MKYIVLILSSVFFIVLLYQKNTTIGVENIDINTTKGINMELNTQVKEQWNRLFKYYENNLTKKCKGASYKRIIEVENEFNVNLPKSFVDSFRICDERYIFNTSKKHGWFGEHEHYSIDNIYYDWYNLVIVNREMREYAEYWKDEWIVFYSYESWFDVILDTKTGQVYLKSATDDNYIIWADSYEKWLKMVVDEVIQYGELRLETIEKLLEIS